MSVDLGSVKTLTAKQIAKKHNLSINYINKQIDDGMSVEKEHTKSLKHANEIARDHLSERPDYYIRLKKMEKTKVIKELGEYDNKGGSIVIGDLTGSTRKVNKMEEENPCWDGYQMIGMKKKRGKKVPNCVPVKEDHVEESPKALVRNFVKRNIEEVAMAMPPAVQPPAIVGQQVPGVRRLAPRPTEVSGRAGGRMAGQSGSMSARPNVKVSSGVQPSIERSWSKTGSARMGTGGGGMSASPTKVGTSFSQGGSDVGQKMAAAKQTSPVVKGMTAAGRDAATIVSKAAPTVSKVAGAAMRVAGGPAATAAMSVMSPTPAGAGEDEKKRQETLKSYNPYKAQGRSVSDYEKQTLTPQKYDTPKTAETPKPTVDAPTPPSRPEYFSRDQAFSAARKEVGGGEGKFSYDNKTYQTNVPGERYRPENQLKQTSIKEEKMDTKEQIQEAISNIMEENLVEMKENFLAVLQEKAMEKLEERKRDIAANYFAK